MMLAMQVTGMWKGYEILTSIAAKVITESIVSSRRASPGSAILRLTKDTDSAIKSSEFANPL